VKEETESVSLFNKGEKMNLTGPSKKKIELIRKMCFYVSGLTMFVILYSING